MNPGLLEYPAVYITDALAGIAVHELWLDYCNIEHDNRDVPPADLVCNTILIHFRLTLEAELSLLKSDLAWWERKLIFKPELLQSPDVIENISNLKSRIFSFQSLCSGSISEEFVTLTPYGEGSRITIFS